MPKCGQLEQVFQSLVQSSFEYLQDWTIHSLSRPVSNYPLFFSSRVPYLHMIPVGDVGARDLRVPMLLPAMHMQQEHPSQARVHAPKVCVLLPCCTLLAGVQDLASSRRDAALSGLDRYRDAVSRVTSGSVKPGFDRCCFPSKA